MINSVSPTSLSSSARSTQAKSVGDVTPEDFVKLLITQLQHQDPLEPMKNNELLQQMSSIRGLQSQLDLTSTLKDLTLQQQISSAGSLIGKTVEGKTANLETARGIVTSVSVESGKVFLDLDNGMRVAVSDVTRVAETSPQQVPAAGQ